MVFVSGGASFIGGDFVLDVLDWLAGTDEPVLNLDALPTPAIWRFSIPSKARHVFVGGGIGDRELLTRLLAEHRPRAVSTLPPRVTSTAAFMGWRRRC